MQTQQFKICSRCLLDSSVTSIRFDETGVCNFCHNHDFLMQYYPDGPSGTQELERLIETIKIKGKGRAYDCIIGVSGGTDSTFVLYQAVKMGLRPLAVHFDNGWNSDNAVTNIKNVTNKLNVDLDTYVVEWEEFKDLQTAFLKASVPCIEAPTDVGIHGALLRAASRENVQFILGGQSFKTEGTVPREWSYLDGLYIKSVHAKYGRVPLRSFPNLTLAQIGYYIFLKRKRQVPILNYIQYDKEKAKAELREVFGWRDYGGHHYENIYSKFAFGWYLPHKFGIDKRKVSLSGPVRSGQMSRDEALRQLMTPPPVSPEIVEYTREKLNLSKSEFQAILQTPPHTYKDFYTSEDILKFLKKPIWTATQLKLLPPVLYQKYFM
jgi:N-acetyl sugar amidotransferase